MQRKVLNILTIVSVSSFVAGLIWSKLDPKNHFPTELYFFGWISFMLVVGYSSTPSNSREGKIAFGFVVIMILGIVMKILHMPAANIIILIGLLGIGLTYFVMWFRKRT